MLNIMEEDARARARISGEIDRNFFVEAAAGSGKTSSLVSRMTAMVAAGTDVSRICAITFTKAAAKEFYSRFQDALITQSREAADETVRKRCGDALRNIDLCFMGTIDAFSNMLLHEHPFEAGMPSDAAVGASGDVMHAYLAEYACLKRGEYGKTLLEKYNRFRAVQTDADTAFTKCIGLFTERREADFIFPQTDFFDADAKYTNWKYKLILTLQFLLEHPEYVGTVKPTQSIYQQLPRMIASLQMRWNGQIGTVLQTLRKNDGLRLGKDSKKQPFDPAEIGIPMPEIFSLHENKSGKPDYWYLNLTASEVYISLKQMQYAATMDFLTDAAQAISAEMCRRGSVTFHDALLMLRNLLRQDAANGGRLIGHIAKRHSYYLVDEFQDTDPLQAEVLFYLTAQIPHPEWTACVPRPGALFIVGDPKQSIYRFRGADVSSFLRVREIFAHQAGEVLTLSRNYRSSCKLRRMFNAVFPPLLQENGTVQSGYHAIPVSETEADTEFSGIYTYQASVSRYGVLTDDAEQVTDVIRHLTGNPAIRLKKGKTPQFRDIMVIAYRKKQTAVLAKQLLAAGIPVRVEGQIDFRDCPLLTAAVRLLQAAALPQDAMAVFRALTSPAFGIPEAALRNFCGAGGRLNAYFAEETLTAQFPEICNALSVLHQAVLRGQSADSAALLDFLTDAAKLPAKTGSASLEYYYFACELLRQREREGTMITHADAAAYLENLLKNAGEERCVSLSPDDNRVHIANLHKVKGLEAPIVILADPIAKAHQPSLRTVHEPERTECRIFSMSSALPYYVTYAETDAFAEDMEAETVCMEAEKARLLYVAATRAENILIIGDSITEQGTHAENNPWQIFLPFAEGTPAACIPANPNNICTPETRSDGDALYAQAAQQSVFAHSDVSAPTYQTVLPSKIRLTPVTAEDEPADAPESIPLDRNAALTGTLVHRLMECIVSGGVPQETAPLISAILREYGAEETVYRPVLEGVLQRMTQGGYPQENAAVPADLLPALCAADAVYCEVPFCIRRGDDLVNGVIDLLYRCGDAWHIIDYKTNAERAHLAEKYAGQLAAYCEAVQTVTGCKPDAAIYHIDV